MTEREKLMKRIQVCDFALNDAALFLDSHPEDKMALTYYKKYQDMRKDAVKDYESKFGPVSRKLLDDERWTWVDGPWPWQKEEA